MKKKFPIQSDLGRHGHDSFVARNVENVIRNPLNQITTTKESPPPIKFRSRTNLSSARLQSVSIQVLLLLKKRKTNWNVVLGLFFAPKWIDWDFGLVSSFCCAFFRAFFFFLSTDCGCWWNFFKKKEKNRTKSTFLFQFSACVFWVLFGFLDCFLVLLLTVSLFELIAVLARVFEVFIDRFFLKFEFFYGNKFGTFFSEWTYLCFTYYLLSIQLVKQWF